MKAEKIKEIAAAVDGISKYEWECVKTAVDCMYARKADKVTADAAAAQKLIQAE